MRGVEIASRRKKKEKGNRKFQKNPGGARGRKRLAEKKKKTKRPLKHRGGNHVMKKSFKIHISSLPRKNQREKQETKSQDLFKKGT